jgi:hypothetical protein
MMLDGEGVNAYTSPPADEVDGAEETLLLFEEVKSN